MEKSIMKYSLSHRRHASFCSILFGCPDARSMGQMCCDVLRRTYPTAGILPESHVQALCTCGAEYSNARSRSLSRPELMVQLSLSQIVPHRRSTAWVRTRGSAQPGSRRAYMDCHIWTFAGRTFILIRGIDRYLAQQKANPRQKEYSSIRFHHTRQ